MSLYPVFKTNKKLKDLTSLELSYYHIDRVQRIIKEKLIYKSFNIGYLFGQFVGGSVMYLAYSTNSWWIVFFYFLYILWHQFKGRFWLPEFYFGFKSESKHANDTAEDIEIYMGIKRPAVSSESVE